MNPCMNILVDVCNVLCSLQFYSLHFGSESNFLNFNVIYIIYQSVLFGKRDNQVFHDMDKFKDINILGIGGR